MISTGTEIVCPRGKNDEAPMVIDLSGIVRSEVRQEEVAIVTPTKAPELLAEFNKSWRELHKTITILMNERNKAEKSANSRKAVVLLEIVPEKLKSLGLPSTADHRQAVLDLDAVYSAATERTEYIECVIEFLKGKAKSFENAYMSVKKIMNEDHFNMSSKNPNLSGDSGVAPVGSWGKPKY